MLSHQTLDTLILFDLKFWFFFFIIVVHLILNTHSLSNYIKSNIIFLIKSKLQSFNNLEITFRILKSKKKNGKFV